jgi:hypothetical protein
MIFVLLLVLLFVILLIAFGFGAWLVYRRESLTPPAPHENVAQKISSPDGNLQATISNRPDGTYQVEVRRREQDNSPDSGVTETWTLVYGPAIIGSLDEAVDIANQRVGG